MKNKSPMPLYELVDYEVTDIAEYYTIRNVKNTKDKTSSEIRIL